MPLLGHPLPTGCYWWWWFLAVLMPMGCSFPINPPPSSLVLHSLLRPLLCCLDLWSKPLKNLVRIKLGRQISCTSALKSCSLVRTYRKCRKGRFLPARAVFPASRAAHCLLQRKRQQHRGRHPTDQLSQLKSCIKPTAQAGNLDWFRDTLCPGRTGKGHLAVMSQLSSIALRIFQTPVEEGVRPSWAESTIWR